MISCWQAQADHEEHRGTRSSVEMRGPLEKRLAVPGQFFKRHSP